MLDQTLVIWMGEFGRTPKINPNAGRDHFPRVFNVALAGGGIKGGQVIGASIADGTEVKDRPVAVNDLLTSFCHALKIDPTKENMSSAGPADQDRRRRQGGQGAVRLRFGSTHRPAPPLPRRPREGRRAAERGLVVRATRPDPTAARRSSPHPDRPARAPSPGGRGSVRARA